MLQRITLSVFTFCLFACASLIFFLVWNGGPPESPLLFQSAASFFIVGLASFLLWFCATLLELKDKIADRY